MRKLLILLLLCAATAVWAEGTLASNESTKKNYVPLTPKLSSDIMTPEVLWSFGRIGSAQVSPDGEKVLYDVTWFNIAENKSYRDLYLVPVAGGESIRLTDTPEKRMRPSGVLTERRLGTFQRLPENLNCGR